MQWKKRYPIVVALLTSCLTWSSPALAEVANLICAQTAPTEYRLSYDLNGDTRAVQIFASPDPTGATERHLILQTSRTAVTVHAGTAEQRMYFFVKPDHGSEREVSIRHLPLEGTPNFRDLGGYETTDGHFVRWGIIYRSGVLTNLTPSDFAYLNQLGVRVVCDFRTADENAKAPEKWIPGADVAHVSVPIDSQSDKGGDSLQTILAKSPSPDTLRAWMMDTYGRFAFVHAPEYAKVFTQLRQDRLPLLYHCTAGKDRTGVFSAFLLLTLGVPEKTVLADYALTNQYFTGVATSQANAKGVATANPDTSRLSPEQLHVLMAADPEYLKATLRRINEKYGSFDNYRRSELGVSDHDVVVLRERLLVR